MSFTNQYWFTKGFGLSIIPIIQSTLSNKEKTKKLQVYIDICVHFISTFCSNWFFCAYPQDAQAFEAENESVINDFDTFTSNFGLFVGKFSNWAEDKKGAIITELEEVQKSLADMMQELKKRKQLNIWVSSATAVMPATGLATWFSGPFAPFVIVSQIRTDFFEAFKLLKTWQITGLLFTGVSVAEVISLAITIQAGFSIPFVPWRRIMISWCSDLEMDISKKKYKRLDLEAELRYIDVTQGQLRSLGKTTRSSVHDSIRHLKDTWVTAKTDSLAIQKWLKGAQGETVSPQTITSYDSKFLPRKQPLAPDFYLF